MGYQVFLYLLVIWFYYVGANVSEADLTVQIKNGKVKGRLLTSYDGRPFRAFQSIPYGKSTDGARRFKPPESVDDWEGVFDATEIGEECAQFNFMTRGIDGNEDCLTINVYTPWNSDQKSLPVMVFIHGGGFNIGTGNYAMYPPEKLMDYDVVLVTFNYRLGMLGFLNTGDENAYGNYAMLDQVLALKWVQENVEKFGGNRQKVVIFGESAGSASVTYHLISPLSKGLFNGAIAQSGTFVGNWSLMSDPLQGALKVAEKVNCPTQNTKEMVDCFRKMSYQDLVYGDRKLKITSFIPHYWSPSIEPAGGPGFLTEHPLRILSKKQITNPVPLIIGVYSHEGYTFVKEFLSLFKKHGLNRVDEVPKVLSIIWKNPKDFDNVYEAVKEKYFTGPHMKDDEEFMKAAIQLLTDMHFKSGTAKLVESLSEAGIPMYTYLVSHVNQYSLAQAFLLPAGIYPAHGDDLFLQFPFLHSQYQRMNDGDTKMAFIMNTLWTTFADKLIPSAVIDGVELKWEKYNNNAPNYLELKLNPEMRKGTLCNETIFWTEALPKLTYQKSQKLKQEL
ncbi:hypothetical protein CHUAL_012953 [Chamberlinius hualienensis]